MRRTFSRRVSAEKTNLQGLPNYDVKDECCVVITGGDKGLGLETAKALASAGCFVTVSSRDADAGEKAAKSIAAAAKVSEDKVRAVQLDLADLTSIQRFAKQVSQGRIDLIICNAGVMCPPYALTPQGFETTMGINHHGHWYLLQLLTPKLKAQPFKSRLVVVSSARHNGSRGFNLDDLHYKQDRKAYKPLKAYDDSKLAGILFAKEYDRRHSNTVAVAVDPGRCPGTNLGRHMGMSRALSNMAFRTVSKSVTEGASSIVYAAMSRDLSTGFGGSYIEDCTVSKPSSIAQDATLAAKLWDITAKETEDALKGATG